jgi:hypothetical protein
VWRLEGDDKVHLPKVSPKMKILYPADLGIQIEAAGEGINVILPRKMMACILTQDQVDQ